MIFHHLETSAIIALFYYFVNALLHFLASSCYILSECIDKLTFVCYNATYAKTER